MLLLCTILGSCQLSLACKANGLPQCRPTKSSSPDALLQWASRGKGFSEWGCGGKYIYASEIVADNSTDLLDVWKWQGTTLDEPTEIKLPSSLAVSCFGEGLCLYWPVPRTHPESVEVMRVEQKAAPRSLRTPEQWYCGFSGPSRNGRFLALGVVEDGPACPGHDYDHPRVKIGLLNEKAEEIQWVTTLVGKRAGADGTIGSIVPSDDAAYVAVGGWDNSVLMVDVAAGQEIWTKRPGRNQPACVGFSPDSKIVYAGGVEGAVFAMDVKTGAVLHQWYATTSGQREQGHEITCLAVSPDGRWVAAGTGPEGQVFVGSAAEGKLAAVLDHGMGTVLIVHFSPDSQALASWVPGTLKVWKVSQWDDGRFPTSRPAPTSQPADKKP